MHYRVLFADDWNVGCDQAEALDKKGVGLLITLSLQLGSMPFTSR